MSIPTVTTQRLTLRSFTAQDVDPLHRILAEPDALRYFPNSDPPSPCNIRYYPEIRVCGGHYAKNRRRRQFQH